MQVFCNNNSEETEIRCPLGSTPATCRSPKPLFRVHVLLLLTIHTIEFETILSDDSFLPPSLGFVTLLLRGFVQVHGFEVKEDRTVNINEYLSHVRINIWAVCGHEYLSHTSRIDKTTATVHPLQRCFLLYLESQNAQQQLDFQLMLELIIQMPTYQTARSDEWALTQLADISAVVQEHILHCDGIACNRCAYRLIWNQFDLRASIPFVVHCSPPCSNSLSKRRALSFFCAIPCAEPYPFRLQSDNHCVQGSNRAE